jgi:general secretion pathway protein G
MVSFRNRPSGAERPQCGSGFTLIELVVVLAVIGALLALAAPRYVAVLERGKVNAQQANIASLRDALDKFYGDIGRYPDRLDELVERRYLRQLPLDPLTGQPDWVLVPPPVGLPGRIYDVRGAATPDLGLEPLPARSAEPPANAPQS